MPYTTLEKMLANALRQAAEEDRLDVSSTSCKPSNCSTARSGSSAFPLSACAAAGLRVGGMTLD